MPFFGPWAAFIPQAKGSRQNLVLHVISLWNQQYHLASLGPTVTDVIFLLL